MFSQRSRARSMPACSKNQENQGVASDTATQSAGWEATFAQTWVREQGQVLVDGLDPVADRQSGGEGGVGPSRNLDGPLVRREGPRRDFDQGALAGSVLPHDALNHSGVHREVHAVESLHSSEPLGNATEPEERRAHAPPHAARVLKGGGPVSSSPLALKLEVILRDIVLPDSELRRPSIAVGRGIPTAGLDVGVSGNPQVRAGADRLALSQHERCVHGRLPRERRIPQEDPVDGPLLDVVPGEGGEARADDAYLPCEAKIRNGSGDPYDIRGGAPLESSQSGVLREERLRLLVGHVRVLIGLHRVRDTRDARVLLLRLV